jgi:hypothetical protein
MVSKVDSKPHLNSVLNVVPRSCIHNVASCRRLDAQGVYAFQRKLNARSSLSEKIKYVSKCTAINTIKHTEEGEIVDAQLGFGLFLRSAEGRTLIAVHAELVARFRSP